MRKQTCRAALLAALLCPTLLLTGCVNSLPDAGEAQFREITFSTELTSTQSPMSLGLDGGEENALTRALGDNITSLAVYDCSADGTLLGQVSQSSAGMGFGTLSLTLAYGTHQLLFVGSKQEGWTFAYPAATWTEKVGDTFSASLVLTVDEDLAATQTVQMPRAVGAVRVLATDAVSPDAASLRITLSAAHASLDLTTGHAHGTAAAMTKTIAIPASLVGTGGNGFMCYTFVPDGGLTTDVTLEVLDAGGAVLSTCTKTGVSVKQNRKTVLEGTVFNRSTGMNISVVTEWDTDVIIPFG